MKLLTTGFAPFGGERINPAWEAVRRLPDRLGEAELIKAEMRRTALGRWIKWKRTEAFMMVTGFPSCADILNK